MSSLAQDELGHARALYELLAEVVADGRDADAIAYDRPPTGYYHARLLDHPRGDWAQTIARRYLYDTADAVRLEALAESSFAPLAALVGKIRREERYHLMHVSTWLERLAGAGGESRRRLLDALERLGPDAATVLAPLAERDRAAHGRRRRPRARRSRRPDGGPRSDRRSSVSGCRCRRRRARWRRPGRAIRPRSSVSTTSSPPSDGSIPRRPGRTMESISRDGPASRGRGGPRPGAAGGDHRRAGDPRHGRGLARARSGSSSTRPSSPARRPSSSEPPSGSG